MDYSKLSDDDIRNMLSKQKKPVENRYSSMSDDEIRNLMKKSPFPGSVEASKPTAFKEFVDSSIPIVPDTLNLAGTAIKSAAIQVQKTGAGIANIANIGLKAGQEFMGVENPRGSETLSGISSEFTERANRFGTEISQQKGLPSKVAEFAGAAAGIPGGFATAGAQLGAQFVEAGDDWLAALGKPVAGAVAGALVGKTAEKVIGAVRPALKGTVSAVAGDKFAGKIFGAGPVESAISNVVGKAAPSAEDVFMNPGIKTGQQNVTAASKVVQEAKDSLHNIVKNTYEEFRPQWNGVIVPEERLKSVLSNSYVKSKVNELSKLKAGDAVQGDIVEAWGTGIKSFEDLTVGKLDALKRFMNQKAFDKGGNIVPQAKGYTDSIVDLNKALKESSSAYAKTLEKVAPLQQANQAFKKVMNKDGDVNLVKLFSDKTGAAPEILANNLKKAGKDGSEVVKGYIADVMGRAGGDVGSMSTTRVIEKVISNQNVLQNMRKFLNKEEAAVVQALYQAKIAVKPDGSKLLEGAIPEAASIFGVAREALKELSSAGDEAFLKSMDKGTTFNSKIIGKVVNALSKASLATTPNNEDK